MTAINRQDLLKWCSIPVEELAKHHPRVPFEVVETREEMGRIMALELVEEVKKNNSATLVLVFRPVTFLFLSELDALRSRRTPKIL